MEDNDDLNDLTNTNFHTEPELTKEEIKLQKMNEKIELQKQKSYEKARIAEEKRLAKEALKKPLENDDLYDDKGSDIIGNDKRILLAKITSYKQLFPNELKGFKIKRGASIELLKEYIEEMDSIVNTSNIDQFFTEGIIHSIRVVEGVSANFKNYDISGMSDLLKSNKEFHSLCKRLMLKYSLFSAVPIEYQMMMLLTTTAYLCRQKNLKKTELNNFLNQPMT